jgi:hypothetical protein
MRCLPGRRRAVLARFDKVSKFQAFSVLSMACADFLASLYRTRMSLCWNSFPLFLFWFETLQIDPRAEQVEC